MTIDKERLRALAEAATGWSNCDKVWPHAEYDGISVLGAICEEGVQYPVAEIDADTYGGDGDSLKLAQFYAGANPAAVLALLAENAALAAEVERLRKDERDACAAGMGDPLVTAAPAPVDKASTPDGTPCNVELRGLWYSAGGYFHGPTLESATMPEALLLPFLRSLLSAHVAEDAEIRKALHDAATSLETISRIAGKDQYMLEMVDVRLYAAARAKVARDAQSAQPEGAKP